MGESKAEKLFADASRRFWVLKQKIESHGGGWGALSSAHERGMDVVVVKLKEAAALGHGNAHYWLGCVHQNGHGVKQSDKEAARWWQKAADHHAGSQFNLGVMYRNGRGVKQSDKEAARWWQKAADQGHADAQYNLGDCFAYGRGVEQNDKEALKWYQKSADQGDSEAKAEADRIRGRL